MRFLRKISFQFRLLVFFSIVLDNHETSLTAKCFDKSERCHFSTSPYEFVIRIYEIRKRHFDN